MKQREAVRVVYQIATLAHPSDDILDLLCQHPFDRCLEVLLILRQSPKPVKAPERFIIRALEENWTPETIPKKIDRRREAQHEKWRQRMGKDSSNDFPFYDWLNNA